MCSLHTVMVYFFMQFFFRTRLTFSQIWSVCICMYFYLPPCVFGCVSLCSISVLCMCHTYMQKFDLELFYRYIHDSVCMHISKSKDLVPSSYITSDH